MRKHYELDSEGLDVSLSPPTTFKEGEIMEDTYAAGKVARINLVQPDNDVNNDQAAAADTASDHDNVPTTEATNDQLSDLSSDVKDNNDPQSIELASDKDSHNHATDKDINHDKNNGVFNKSVNYSKNIELEKSVNSQTKVNCKQNSAEANDPLYSGSLTNLVSFSGSNSVSDRLNDAISETLNIENELMKEVNLVNKLSSAKVDKNVYQLCFISTNSLNKNDSSDKSASRLTKDPTPSDKDNTVSANDHDIYDKDNSTKVIDTSVKDDTASAAYVVPPGFDPLKKSHLKALKNGTNLFECYSQEKKS